MENNTKVTEHDLSFDIQELFRDLCAEVNTVLPDTGVDFDLEADPEYVADYLKSKFVELILKGMEKKGLSKTDLAQELNKSPQYISKIINETANFTIESMAAISCALGMTLEINMYEKVATAITDSNTTSSNMIYFTEILANHISTESYLPSYFDSVQMLPDNELPLAS